MQWCHNEWLAGPDLAGISGGSSHCSFIPPTSPKAKQIKYLSYSRYESTLEDLWIGSNFTSSQWQVRGIKVTWPHQRQARIGMNSQSESLGYTYTILECCGVPQFKATSFNNLTSNKHTGGIAKEWIPLAGKKNQREKEPQKRSPPKRHISPLNSAGDLQKKHSAICWQYKMP